MSDSPTIARVPIGQLRATLADTVVAVATTQQPVIITNRGRALAALVPLAVLEQAQAATDAGV